MTDMSNWPERLPFTKDDIERSLSRAAAEKADLMMERGDVRGVEWLEDKARFVATVVGTQKAFYRVSIRFKMARAGVNSIHGECSCPMQFNCKHVGATLYEVRRLHRQERDADTGSFQAERGAPAKAQAHPASPVQLDPNVARWLTELDKIKRSGSEIYEEGIRNRLIYVLQLADTNRAPALSRLAIAPFVATLLKDGGFSDVVKRAALQATGTAQYLRPSDHELLGRLRNTGDGHMGQHSVRLAGEAGATTLLLAARTGRLRLGNVHGVVLEEGEALTARIVWETSEVGDQLPTLSRPREIEGEAWLANLAPPIAVDLTKGTLHRLRVDGVGSDGLLEAFLDAPPLDFRQAQYVAAELDRRISALQVPSPRPLSAPKPLDAAMRPKLQLAMAKAMQGSHYGQSFARQTQELSIARLTFQYGPVQVAPSDKRTRIVTTIEGALRSIQRQQAAERAALDRLRTMGTMFTLSERGFDSVDEAKGLAMACRNSDEWLEFMMQQLPRLEAEGWLIEISDDFPLQITPFSGSILADVKSGSGIDWLELELGTMVDGTRLDLVPLLAEIIQRGVFSNPGIIRDDGYITLKYDDKHTLPLPAAVLKPIVDNLHALFEGGSYNAETRQLRIGRYQLVDLGGLETATDKTIVWRGNDALRALAAGLRESGQIPALPPPVSLNATLRPYQARGIDWLQFLGQAGFGGILADDMGLGKTLQALAHLLHEKAAGRLDTPALVICPTSLVGNWEREAGHFAPSLKVLALHGLDRAKHFEVLAAHDLVISTYPLVSRDHKVLSDLTWSMIVLDEAQTIKNPEALTTQNIAALPGRQKIALTGTPLENHLGELWSIFNVLAPGFLGDKTGFTRHYRTPIEKKGDKARLAELTRRIRPFMLRRTKAEVAPELPPKNELPEIVSLEPAQRTLYESVRLAMHERVREAIRAQGLKRSTIVILDALLKMRQACCDPRLVKLKQAAVTKARSAKLDRLMEMLPSLIDEGRRILLFSQFTSMLALIEAELAKAKIPYVLLTGDTKDRRTPVDQFQKGKVPLFLISLKAGGSGLNLTAADTVIHYDPWWNPAVEAQATDRAHRIGQTKTVFVHKMIAEDTVEEKIEILKARKAALASSLLDPGGGNALELSEADIEALFA